MSAPNIELVIVHNEPANPMVSSARLYIDGELVATNTNLTEYASVHDSWRSNYIRKELKLSSYSPSTRHVYEPSEIAPTAKDFKFVTERYQWSCGDGCCSDSGYKGEIYFRDQQVASWDDWEHNRDRDYQIEMMLDWISNRFGIEFKPDDIETSKITTEDGDWDDKLGYRPRNEYEDYY